MAHDAAHHALENYEANEASEHSAEQEGVQHFSRDPRAVKEAAGEVSYANEIAASNGQDGGEKRGMVILAATPIGNVGDASARLRYNLAHADIVAAEDTRRLYDLANRLGIHVSGRVVAYHDHNEDAKADGLLDEVEKGATILVVSDAGMPTVNDPGHAIVGRAIARNIPLTCAPGPSAVLDAIALAGLPTDRFCYEGFMPRKHSEKLTRLRSLLTEQRTIVFFETAQRISETMHAFEEVFTADRPMALARELTKEHEEIRRSTVAGIARGVEQDPPRGEIVLVIQGASSEEVRENAAATIMSVEDMAREALSLSQQQNIRVKDAISQVVEAHPLPDGSFVRRKQVYQAVLELQEN